MKKNKIPWSESPAGREHAEFAKRAMLGRPLTDETKCFVCQEAPPTVVASRGKESFGLCLLCSTLVAQENERRNRIKTALGRGRGGDIFRMTLGADLLPSQLRIKPIEGAR